MTDQNANFVGSIPEYYDRGLGPVLLADFADDTARRVAAFAPARVLETCAGTGIVTRRLRDLLPAAQLTATDLNPPMLEVARSKFDPEEAVVFRPADATALPFDDGQFDMVVCQFGVMFFPDKPKSYREAYRVLSSGGHYVFSVWDAARYNPMARMLDEVLARFFPDDPPTFMQIPFGYYQVDEIREATAEAGFRDFTASVVSFAKPVEDWASFSHGQVHGSPLIEQIRNRGGIEPDAVVAALLKALLREFGGPSGLLPRQTIVFTATRG
jgi:ubiquinone/menaquinone biosynthesis C-methylase UbiE